jgi:hypothetical protein
MVRSCEGTHQLALAEPDTLLQGQVSLGSLEVPFSHRSLFLDLEVFIFKRELVNGKPAWMTDQAGPCGCVSWLLISDKEGFPSIDTGLDWPTIIVPTLPD